MNVLDKIREEEKLENKLETARKMKVLGLSEIQLKESRICTSPQLV